MKRLLFILAFFSFLFVSEQSMGQRYRHRYHPHKVVVVKHRPAYRPRKVVVVRQRPMHYRPRRIILVQQRPVRRYRYYARPTRPTASVTINARF